MPFITFEGGEGAGKSTQIELLAKYLQDAGKTVTITREPGGTTGAEAIRNLLRGSEDWLPLSETLLQFAARLEHVEKLIKPALERGEFVLSDRFTDSTFAYQGYGMGIAMETIAQINAISLDAFKPDLTILLDLPAEMGLERAMYRDGNRERYEAMPLAFHRRLHDGFLALAASEPERWRVIDAQASLEDIARHAGALVSERFSL
jgi:dTMP kinase